MRSERRVEDLINALVERFRLEHGMVKAGIIKGNFVFDVIGPSIGIGLIYGSYRWEYLLVTAFLMIPIFSLIDRFVIKPNLLWRDGTGVVMLIGIFWYSCRRIIPIRTWFSMGLLGFFLLFAVGTAVFIFQTDLWFYRAYKDVYLRQKEVA